ncbi:MAG: hypothetical protein WBP64_13840 [Nitrososphaeraceae archaeon]
MGKALGIVLTAFSTLFAVGAASTVDYNITKMIPLLAISGRFMPAAAVEYRRGAKEGKPMEVSK